MEEIKVVFLDIDGVLNGSKTKERTPKQFEGGWSSGIRYTGIEPPKVELLVKLLLATDAKIVLSSTWRNHEELHYYMWKQLGPLVRERYIDKTDYIPNTYTNRGKEIYDWIEANKEKYKITKFVILDDDSGVEDYFGQEFIKTSYVHGLTEENIKESIIKLT